VGKELGSRLVTYYGTLGPSSRLISDSDPPTTNDHRLCRRLPSRLRSLSFSLPGRGRHFKPPVSRQRLPAFLRTTFPNLTHDTPDSAAARVQSDHDLLVLLRPSVLAVPSLASHWPVTTGTLHASGARGYPQHTGSRAATRPKSTGFCEALRLTQATWR
jgi:hypothetical protein